MPEHEYRYYLARGKELAAAAEWRAENTRRNEALHALAAEVGSIGPVTRRALVGFIFEGHKPPPGWQKAGAVQCEEGPCPYFAPPRRKKADRALWDRMNSVRRLDASDFAKLIGAPEIITGIEGPRFGVMIRYVGFEEIDGQIILRVPLPVGRDDVPEWTPAEGIPLKLSEYFAMKENVADALAPAS